MDMMDDPTPVEEKSQRKHHFHDRNGHFLGITFQSTYHVILRIICISTVLVQTGIMDYYIVVHKGGLIWCLWAIPDLIVLAAFLFTVIQSYSYLKPRPLPTKQSTLRKHAGELPMTYITWFLYACVLSGKIWILHELPDRINTKLIEVDFFGPNMLKTAISLSSIIFYSFVLSSHDTTGRSSQSEFINCIVGTVYLDLLDTTQFMGVLREEQEITRSTLLHIVLTIVTVNFLLPTEAIYILTRSHFGKYPFSRRFQFLHKIMFMLIYNLPFFIVRMTVWHMHDQNVSVFLMKNVMVLGLAIKDIHEFVLEINEVVSESPSGDPSNGKEIEELALVSEKEKEAALHSIEVKCNEENTKSENKGKEL